MSLSSRVLVGNLAAVVFAGCLIFAGSGDARAEEPMPSPTPSIGANGDGFDAAALEEADSGSMEEGAGQSLPPVVEVPAADPVPERPTDAGEGVPYCADESSGQVDAECVSSTADVCDPDEILAVAPPGAVVADPCAPLDVDRPVISSEGAPEEDDPADRPDLVAQEFRRLEIPRPTIALQDEVEDQASPGKMWGVSMIGEYANMWTESPDHTLSTTLLSTEVTIRATPFDYTWDYGDGQSRKTATAGGPMRSGAAGTQTATSHAYQETGFYPVSVTTTYTGQFKTPASDWIPIPGVATVTSPAKTATVWKSETRLVSGDCSENPGSWGCETVPFPWEGGPQTSEAFKAAQKELEARQ